MTIFSKLTAASRCLLRVRERRYYIIRAAGGRCLSNVPGEGEEIKGAQSAVDRTGGQEKSARDFWSPRDSNARAKARPTLLCSLRANRANWRSPSPYAPPAAGKPQSPGGRGESTGEHKVRPYDIGRTLSAATRFGRPLRHAQRDCRSPLQLPGGRGDS